MAEKKLVYFQMYTSFKMIKVECSSWFVLVYSVCWKQTESTWDTNQLLPFAVMHLEFFSEKITTILTILLHFPIKTYDKVTDTLGKLKPWRNPCFYTWGKTLFFSYIYKCQWRKLTILPIETEKNCWLKAFRGFSLSWSDTLAQVKAAEIRKGLFT